MKAGTLRHQVVVQKRAMTRDSLGAPVETWSTFATVFAEVQPLRGREYLDIRAAQSEVTTRIRMRYLAGMNTTMRITHDGAIYRVVDVINENSRDRMIECMCVSEAVDA